MQTIYYLVIYQNSGKDVCVYPRIFTSYLIAENYANRSLLPKNKYCYNTILFDGFRIDSFNLDNGNIPF